MENFHCNPDKPLNYFDDSECFPKVWEENKLGPQKDINLKLFLFPNLRSKTSLMSLMLG